MSSPRLFVVIPVHNRKDITRSCLQHVSSQSVKEFSTVVVDDGSTDGTDEMVSIEFPDVVLLRGDGQLWWAGAMNLGVQYCLAQGASHILSLNDDTEPSPGFIERMLAASKAAPSSLIGAFAVDAHSRRPVFGGEIIDWRWAKYRPLLSELTEQDQKGLHEVTHAPGRGLLIPAEVFATVGLFDSRHFPQTIADYDLSHRALKSGYKIYCDYDNPLPVFPNASGDRELRRNKSIGNYRRHLFGLKGGGNLKGFAIYAWRNCPKRWLLPFLVCGFCRRILGYLRDWAVEWRQGCRQAGT